ncbi:P-loop containing nucleoside triphosphate hydrolase protein [Metschnikowia bicuspidata var. bicuspidata NRRL YB-4993]|uniref:p-loop containing nucleoside triphosphate hydrolase protein n=1 Tax=Metschnikowia bicuspidata var. bicuspidata NRRL YB-4993 TaxID=869754 RepID=A0A1A0HGP1_9ASCO|nr:P-loop containing nucleoside triphosphate hydrolase protein [Metschnikowia bicuspidata var. bicuspidata NRRL YB-4993]OBA23339.1 P-loop containing nucleoside triphosphate hydrolase protein [Metschnikowia bicuspidata var. bicuspidata NRRL YB-4993]
MFHLALSLYTQYTKREQYNLLILGLDNAGKTTFLEHIKLLYPAINESLKEKDQRVMKSSSTMEGTDEDSVRILKGKRILPTVGQNTTTIRFKPNESSVSMSSSAQFRNINLKFWDLGGQKSLRSMWSRYYRSCHGIIFIIDSTDTERFQECYETLMDIAHDSSWALDGNVSVPILMLANKQDLPQAVDLVTLKTGVFIRVVSQLEATDLKLLPVSVLENHGLRDSLDWLVTRLVYNKGNRAPEYK